MGPVLSACTANTNTTSYKQSFNQISPKYQINQFKQPSSQVPHYNDPKYVCLVDQLLLKKQKFRDEIYPNELLFRQKQIGWKRITEIYPKAKLHNQQNFNFQYDQQSLKGPYVNKNFVKAIKRLVNQPDLIKKIFSNLEISQVGIYVLYLCIDGNIEKPVEIVIDDYVPVNAKGQYFLARPKNDLVWMILLQKVWAKVLKQYANIQYLTSAQLYQETTGIPSMQIFRPNYYLKSMSMPFEPISSKYIKFTISDKVQITLTIWQPLEELYCEKSGNYNKYVMELIEGNSPLQYTLKEAQYESKQNKLLLSSNGHFLSLNPGNYILHIFNRGSDQLTSNLVLYSSKRVDLHPRKQIEFSQMKHIMIKNYYKTQHNLLKIAHQNNQITSRFCWNHHRGILCLKNITSTAKKLIVTIDIPFQNQIFFEDQMNIPQKQRQAESGQHCFFIFVRKRDEDFGKFFTIS